MQGQDKGLLELSGRPIVAYVIEAISLQTGQVLINANRNLEIYRRFGYPVISDRYDGFAGPLAGIASCLEAATTELVACAPCDSPFLPGDLVARLYHGMQQDNADICMPHDGTRTQPVFALIKTTLRNSLQAFLARGGRKTELWYAETRLTTADFSDQPEAFLNINTSEDIQIATRRLEQRLS
jgi:molybdopterin-guanine dinucleotide biosynthesis protein A